MTREEFLAARLSELTGYWIDVSCSRCVARVDMPCKLHTRDPNCSLTNRRLGGGYHDLDA